MGTSTTVGIDGYHSLLQKKVNLLRSGTDYKLLFETISTMCMRSGATHLPNDVLANIADLVLRPIARDISSQVPGSKIMLHIYVSEA